jgi:hypothetical protein
MQKWSTATILKGENLPSSFKANSSISIWFYIKTWTNEVNLVEFKETSTSLFKIQCMNAKNTIQIFPTSGATSNDDCNIPDFPLQKWVNLIVSFNGSAMDVYVDGKLMKSCVVNLGSKLQRTNEITLGGGTAGSDIGFITNVKLKSSPIAPQEAWDIYSQGFGGSPWGDLLNKYKVKLSFIVDNQEQASVST